MKTVYLTLLLSTTVFISKSQNKNEPVLHFTEDVYTFDTLVKGDACVHDFEFTNTGNAPLVFSQVQTSCGCDVVDWPKEPILPGQKGKIRYKYDSNRLGPFHKTVSVTGNFKEGHVILKAKGYIKE